MGRLGGGGPPLRPRGAVRLRAIRAHERTRAGNSDRGLGAAGLFAYDTMTLDRARHMGGGAGRNRRRADRRRPRHGRGAAVAYAAAARPATTSRGRLRRLVLPEQHGRRGRRVLTRVGRAGRRGRHRRPPRQRDAGAVPRPRRRAHGVGARRPGRRLVPPLPRLRGREGDAANLNLPLAPGTGDDGLARSGPGGSRVRRSGAHGTRRRTRRRRRRRRSREPARGERRGYREAGRILGELGLPTVVVQEGGYDLATIGSLVVETLTGCTR